MRALFLSIPAILLAMTVNAQLVAPAVSAPRKIALGFNLNNIGGDFGAGINACSPAFFGGHAAIRATANYQWTSHPDAKGQETWTPYSHFRLGALGIHNAIANGILLYGEGGVSLTLMNGSMSSEPVTIGGYGLFGFEFLMHGGVSYFIELGGSGTGAVAEKLPSSPIVANGFLTSTGFRVRL